MRPKVTIYIPSHRYGRYLGQAIESVLSQSLAEWEMIIINDGAEDETAAVSKRYQDLYPDKIRVIQNSTPRGLQACANLALKAAKGDYIMRLDADDYLDESALLVMVSYLECHKDVALVYPNYTYVAEDGKFLALEERKRIGREAKLLDLPAHGACTLIRKRVLKSLGGYSEQYSLQDGYELWLKVLQRYPVGNVGTPLFFYRQHSQSQSKNEESVLEARSRIKRDRVMASNGPVKPLIAAIVGAKNTYPELPNIVFAEVGKRRLIDYTLESAIESGVLDKIVVSTDDPKVAEYCAKLDGVSAMVRPAELSAERVTIAEVVSDATNHIEKDQQCYPDILVYLNMHAPLRRAAHIREAVDTLILYNTDSIISVYEDFDLHYTHAQNGLEPLSKVRHEQLRIEREALYVDNRAIKVAWRDILSRNDMSGVKVGHIVMTREESFHIRRPFDVWLLDKILSERSEHVSFVR